jgi:hypothetical protein
VSSPDISNRDAGAIPVATMTPPVAQAAHISQPERRLRVLGAVAGITGPVVEAVWIAAAAIALARTTARTGP